MSYRYSNAFIDPGLNTLVSPAPQYTYYLYSWGQNDAGQLGLGNRTNYSSPKQVGSLTNWLNISGAYKSVGAIKTDGTLWTWGQNASGTLGLGNTTNYSSPKQVGSLTNWLQIAAGSYHGIAIKTDGTLWAWGRNQSGQLGLGNRTNYSSPVQVGALTNWSSVAGGGVHSMAIKTDGTLWAIGGDNSAGQLGISSLTNKSSPNQVGSLTNWLQVACGSYFTAAVKTDGTLWVWGINSSGQLGLNVVLSAFYSSPKQVGALTNWSKVACGPESTFAVKTTGALWDWGHNYFGDLGIGSNSNNYSSPKQVGVLTNWLSVAAGYGNAAAVKTDGTLWTWGISNSGQLGLNNRTYYSSPKQVGSLTTWKSTAANFANNAVYGLQY
jgi:alpha-tubulin suppressor-like RCC1 family protein